MEYNDITETGYSNWNNLQELNDEYQGIQDYLDTNPPRTRRGGITEKQRQQLVDRQQQIQEDQLLLKYGIQPYKEPEHVGRYNPQYVNFEDQPYMSPMAETETPFGESRYDDNVQSLYQLEHLKDVRAQNQSGLNKLAAGTAKAAVLAGTTFLDGTVGLVYGLTSAVIGTAKDIANGTFQWDGSNFSKVFDNEISNGFRQINQEVERVIPNYRSELEDSRQWYQNMGTANFWADFLKQVGFTVGAFYSGAAWTKTLKAINLVKNPFGAKVTGSFMSGVNEGRIEANQIQDEHYNRELDLLNKSFQAETDSIMNRYYNGQITAEQANAALQTVYDNRDESERKIKADSDKVGLIDLAINVPILTLDNMLMYGKAYSRGFNNANKAVNKRRTFIQKARDAWKQADKEANILEDEIAKNTKKTVSGYGWDTITKGQAALKGAGHFLREGNEEMMQAYASEFASALYQPDSPDAYYQALYDPNALDNTKDFYQSAVQGFMNSYGNLDRWQEFIMGGLTGLLGTVTFGRSQNQSPDTWRMFKGKRIGVTGGIFGELAAARTYNQKGQANVDFMNQYVQRRQEDFENNVRHFAASDHFTTLMNGWAEESNKFEYENAKNNDDWEALVRFNNSGRMQDLKDMMNQDFSDLSDEDLDVIARSQDNSDQWKNPDGTYMSETPEGRAKMREKLEQNRNELLKSIDDFERSYQSVVNITNDNLTEEQNLELAWLKWKGVKFNDRYSDIREKNRPFFQMLKQSAQEYVNAFDQTVDESKLSDNIDDKTKLSDKQKYQQAKTVVDNAGKIIQLIDYLDNSSSALEFQRKAGLNYKMLNQIIDEDTYDLFASQTDMSYDQYKETVQNLLDAAKLGIAANQFDERLKEYMDNPEKIEEHHSKVRQNVDKAVDGFKSNKQADQMMDMDIEVISRKVDEGGLSQDGNGDIVTEDGLNITKNVGKDKADQIKQKFDQAKKRVDNKNEIIDVIQDEEFDFGDIGATSEDLSVVTDFVDDSFENGQFAHIENLDIDAIDDSMMLTYYEIEDNDMTDEEKHEIARRRKTILLVASTTAQERSNEKDQISENSPTETHDNDKIDDQQKQTGVNDRIDAQNPVNTDKGRVVEKEQKSSQNEQKHPKKESEIQSSYIEESSMVDEQPEQPQNQSIPGVLPGLTELPLSEFRNTYGISKYDYRSFGQVVADMTQYDFDEHSPKDMSKLKYSEDYVRYICETDMFLREHRAFENRYSNSIKVGSKVHFGFSKELNSAAGTNVILILDEDNNVIGNLNPFENNSVRKPMVDYLNSVCDNMDTDNPMQIYVLEKNGEPIISYVNQEYIGQIPYSEARQSIRNIIPNVSDIMFGIVKESGADTGVYTRKSDFPNSDVRPPKKAAVGQVFLCIRSASSTTPYVTVNIYTPRFGDGETVTNAAGNQTLFDKYVRNIVDLIVRRNLDNAVDTNMAGKISAELNNMFSGQQFGIECENGRITYIHVGNSDGTAETGRTVLYSRNEELTPQLLYDRIVEARMPVNIRLDKINNEKNLVQGTGASYNQMIAEISTVNLVPGTLHTKNDFFSIDILDENGNVLRTQKPETVPMRSVTETKVITDDDKFIINKDNWDVTQRQTGTVFGIENDFDAFINNKDGYDGAKERLLARAQEYTSSNRAINPGQNKIVNLVFNGTFYLQYNTQTKQLIVPYGVQNRPQNGYSTITSANDDYDMEIVERDEVPVQAQQPQNEYPKIDWESIDVNTAKNWFEESGLRNDYGYLWDRMKDDDYKKIYSVRDVFNIDEVFSDYEIFGTSQIVDDYLNGGQFREVDVENNTRLIEKEETEWLKQFYPELSKKDRLKVIQGFVKMSNDKNAWGMFNNGMIVLSDKAASGTLYHEAFHSISHTLLTQDELNKMLDVVRNDNPSMNNIQLEEILAEDFRGYMQTEVSNHRDNAIVRAFKMLKNFILGWRSKQYVLTNMYYRISQGIYASRDIRYTDAVIQISEYHNVKNDYENLSDEQKQYLNDNQVTEEQYNKLTDDEKENFLYCIS